MKERPILFSGPTETPTAANIVDGVCPDCGASGTFVFGLFAHATAEASRSCTKRPAESEAVK